MWGICGGFNRRLLSKSNRTHGHVHIPWKDQGLASCLVDHQSSGESWSLGLPSEQEPLNWPTRLRIAVGAAKGFNYLHNDCSPAIIHRDLKCSNILLDKNLDAKVADFGLSKLLSHSSLTHITTGVKGTFGYLYPEYAQTERLTEKSDAYAFGVILLELLTGSKAIMQNSGEYVHIAQWNLLLVLELQQQGLV
ncbi:hypothetical protein GOP47_0008379 [Adiantum capillus-veneris]|uniref:non-specific serine/threonine protein kinase n=1 Tax=Adiantum capillus-veneris TaxID=13818 RepID=A0A9D4ZI46_ADICA|nr:hypothetical protein GOP47_0008379 [Adiantum capillus-veneris]